MLPAFLSFRNSAIALAVAWALLVVYRKVTRRRLQVNCFKGKRVVITGASSGMGADMARIYARYGASVVLAARRIERLNELAAECRAIQAKNASGGTGYQPEVVVFPADMSKEEDCKELIEAAISALGRIDVLVLNAGVSYNVEFVNSTFEQLRNVMDINYWGYVYPTYYALPHLKKTNGSIMVVSSLAGKIPTPLRTGYASGKHALHGFFDCLRFEVAPEVSITITCPGYVVTEIHDKQLREQGKKRNMSQFMSSEEASTQMVEATLNRDRLLVMTTKARLGLLAREFLPNFILDRMIVNGSKNAFKDD